MNQRTIGNWHTIPDPAQPDSSKVLKNLLLQSDYLSLGQQWVEHINSVGMKDGRYELVIKLEGLNNQGSQEWEPIVMVHMEFLRWW